MEGGAPTIVTNAEGGRTTPSVVAYTKAGDRLVGQIAKRQGVVNPENTFYSVKRFIGRRHDEISNEAKEIPYTVVNSAGNVKLDCPALGKNLQRKRSRPRSCANFATMLHPFLETQ